MFGLRGAEEDRMGVVGLVPVLVPKEFLKRGALDEEGVQAGPSCRDIVGGASSSFMSMRFLLWYEESNV